LIGSIQVQDLRGIREGRLDELTQLVILVGPNGCGKSTILDALFIAANAELGEAIERIAHRRVDVVNDARWLAWRGKQSSRSMVEITFDDDSQSLMVRILGLESTAPKVHEFARIIFKVRNISGDREASTTALT
jgi:predicted ATPase